MTPGSAHCRTAGGVVIIVVILGFQLVRVQGWQSKAFGDSEAGVLRRRPEQEEAAPLDLAALAGKGFLLFLRPLVVQPEQVGLWSRRSASRSCCRPRWPG